MTKNILQPDVVHHTINIMMAWLKRALPAVTFSGLFDASRLLKDEPHPFASRSYPKDLRKGIKLNHNSCNQL